MHREYIVAFAWRKWLRERATMLHYTYVFYLVLARSELKNHVLHSYVVGKVQKNFLNLVFKCCVIDPINEFSERNNSQIWWLIVLIYINNFIFLKLLVRQGVR